MHENYRFLGVLLFEGASDDLCLETIQKLHENYQKAFVGFDPARVEEFMGANKKRLSSDQGIIRHRLTIHAAMTNVQVFLTI